MKSPTGGLYTKSLTGGWSRHEFAYRWTEDQSLLQVDGLNTKSPTKVATNGRSKHEVAYRWTDDQSRLRVDGLNTKSSTKVASRWMV